MANCCAAAVVDYLHPDDVVDADGSSSELLEVPGRLGTFVPPPSRRRRPPQSNAVQPAAELQEPRAALPRPGDVGGNVWKRGGGGGDVDVYGDGEETLASVDEEKDTGYSSGPDDENDNEDN